MSEIEYHLREVQIAHDAGDTRRILPTLPPNAKCVLDIGCGAGQTLLALDLRDRWAVGVDLDEEALQLGCTLSREIHFVRAQGERLPFGERSFDLVFSRVALPYMDIPLALQEMARVLRPEGSLWITLHPLSMLSWRAAFASLKTLAFEIYRLVNTGFFTLTGRVFRYPLRLSRIECYQTERGMRLALEAAGFGKIAFHRAQHFVVTASLVSVK